MSKATVVVGMSGGVDSSVAAYLLKQEGYTVIGVTMQIWQSEDPAQVAADNGCCGLSAIADARRVAQTIGIDHYVMNFRDDFQKTVIDYFVDAYASAQTPNPCIACNRYVKWESLLQRSRALGADYIATGHYARIRKLPSGRYTIYNSVTAQKDQTYALYSLTQEQLQHTLMPVGDYTKDQIRAIAEKIGLRVAKKPDSQDICFVPDHDYASFVEAQRGESFAEGNFVDTSGSVLGRHRGIIHYTVGQRKGLGLSLGRPAYVVAIDAVRNEVIIGDDCDIRHDALLANDVNYMAEDRFDPNKRYRAKIRYAHEGDWCRVETQTNGRIRIVFEKPQRAITPGQAVVLYIDDCVAGGATILRAEKN